MYGWAGTILYVDLTRKKIWKEPLSRKLMSFIGGRGINVKILYDMYKPGTDAFDPSNPIIFGTGPSVGTSAPAASRFNVTTRSPLGYLGDGNCGGFWSPELKRAGYDHIVVLGKAQSPVYLWVEDDHVELIDASNLWGKDTWVTEKIIRKEHNDQEIQILSIGQAGENLVRFACVRTGPKRAAGRTGSGAVMGSKNLKAIAVRGTGTINVADEEGLKRAVRKAFIKLKNSGLYKTLGVPGCFGAFWFKHQNGDMLSTRHHSSGYWKDAGKLDPAVFRRRWMIRRVGCAGCTVKCSQEYVVKDSPYGEMRSEVPEFGGFVGLSSVVDNSDWYSVLKANEVANEYGLDLTSTGGVISFAMELYEKGIINRDDVGFPLHWGEGESIIKMIEMIAKREGFGDILAEGEVRAAKKIGKGAQEYVLAIKNVEQHEVVRATKGSALAEAVSSRGSDHLRGQPLVEMMGLSPDECKRLFGFSNIGDPEAYENKGRVVANFYERICAISDMMEMCKFQSEWVSPWCLTADDYAELFSTITGVEMDAAGFYRAADRLINLERAFIAREGIRRKDDYPSWREFKEPLPSGPRKGAVLDKEKYDRMLDEYYEARGWDKNTGVPKKETLEKLKLKDVVEVLS